MKNNYLSIVILLISIQFGFSQDYEVKLEAETIIENRHIYLNGGMRSQFGGKSRTYIKVDLPPNTKEWYYSFTTTEGESGTENLNLAVQLAGVMADPVGITSSALSAIKIPDGVATADIYLMDEYNLQPFVNKEVFNQYTEALVQNTKQALVRVDDIKSGTWYLGIKNPSSMNGINLNIEVVAITETPTIIEKSESQQKAELYGNLGWSAFEKGNYKECIEFCDKANAEFELGWVLANKGLSLLAMGDKTKAQENYINAITLIKKQSNSSGYLRTAIKDLKKAKKKIKNLNGADEIKELIQASKQL